VRKGGLSVFRRLRTLWARALATVLTLGLLGACSPSSDSSRPMPGLNSRPLLVEVYPNGWALDGSDQYVRLHNPLTHSADISHWIIGDQVVRARFPMGSTIASGQTVYIARSISGFKNLMGGPPDFVWGFHEADPTTRALSGGQLWSLSRENGFISLADASDSPVDSVAFGRAIPPSANGWRGNPAPAPSKGEVLDRARDEASWTAEQAGHCARDTDTARDWKQGDTWMDLRIYRPGQTWFPYPTYQVSQVAAYASPDSSYAVLTKAIDLARERIDIFVYEFSMILIAERLAAAAKRGIQVRVHLEIGSFNRLYDQKRYVAKLITDAGGEVRSILPLATGAGGRWLRTAIWPPT